MGYHEKYSEILGGVVCSNLLSKCIDSIEENDLAHRNDHVLDVCQRGRELYELLKDDLGLRHSDLKVILHACLMHDLGCKYNRDDHHLIGYGLVYDFYNKYSINVKLTNKELELTAICVMEHRSSNPKPPSNILSEIVSIADTGKPVIDKYLKRTLLYRMSNPKYKGCSEEYLFKDCILHMKKKFDRDGYHWISYPPIGLRIYKKEWDEFTSLLNDEKTLLNKLSSIYNSIKIG